MANTAPTQGARTKQSSPKPTRHQRASAKLQKLQAERDTLAARPELTDRERRSLPLLDERIKKAKKAVDRALTDESRRQESIDAYRKTPKGRDEYNRRRRKRDEPNADLTGWTPEEKEQRRKDISKEGDFIRRRKQKGMPEAQIYAELIAYRRDRDAKREEAAQEVKDTDAMKASPFYAMF